MADIGSGYVVPKKPPSGTPPGDPPQPLPGPDEDPPFPSPNPPPTDDGNGNGNGGNGNGNGGSGGGGGDGPFTPPPYTPPPTSSQSKEKDRYANYLSILESWGIAPGDQTEAMRNLAHQAAKKHWSSGTFMHFARQTEWYHQFFLGKPARMSEGAYNAQLEQYQKFGNQIGEHIDRHQFAYLISHNIGMNEFQDRVLAIQKIDNNRQTMDAFIDTLRAEGIIKRGAEVKDEDLYRFVIHRGPEEWYKVWDEARVRMAAAEAGFQVGHNITRQQIVGMAHELQGPTPMSIGEIEKGYQDLAAAVRTLLPQARAVGMQISRRELNDLAFGGPRRAQAQAKAQSIMQRFKVATTATAPVPQLVQTGEGARLLGGYEGLGGSAYGG